MLFPTDVAIEKSNTMSKVSSDGAAVTELPQFIPNNSHKWKLIPQTDAIDTYYIYNEAFKGFLNAYSSFNVDFSRRFVFVGNDRRDAWKFYKLGKNESFAIENLPTREFIYPVLYKGHKNHYKLYPEQTTRSVFTYQYTSMRELEEDTQAHWHIQDCSED